MLNTMEALIYICSAFPGSTGLPYSIGLLKMLQATLFWSISLGRALHSPIHPPCQDIFLTAALQFPAYFNPMHTFLKREKDKSNIRMGLLWTNPELGMFLLKRNWFKFNMSANEQIPVHFCPIAKWSGSVHGSSSFKWSLTKEMSAFIMLEAAVLKYKYT